MWPPPFLDLRPIRQRQSGEIINQSFPGLAPQDIWRQVLLCRSLAPLDDPKRTRLIKPLSIGILGAGRMGQAIAHSIASCADVRLAYVWVRDKDRVGELSIPPDIISSDLSDIVAAADVLIDFSLPGATRQVAEAVVRYQKPLVSGVSGLDEAQLASLEDAAAVVPVVYDRNMSVGVAVLEELVRVAAASLGPTFEVEIHETHHIHKKDAPSGTALKLGEAVAKARDQDLNAVTWYEPHAGARAPSAGDIRFEVERRGEVAGDHSVKFRSATEVLTLSHSVTTRQVFAQGALHAARWVVGQEPGLYLMKDVLFGKAGT